MTNAVLISSDKNHSLEFSDINILKVVTPGKEAYEFLQNNPDQLIVIDYNTAIDLNKNLNKNSTNEYICIKSNNDVIKLNLSNIYYFMAENKHVAIYSKNNKFTINLTLDEIENKFNKKLIRIHRKYLINIDHIQSINKNENGEHFVKLKNTELKFPISRRKISIVKKIIFGK